MEEQELFLSTFSWNQCFWECIAEFLSWWNSFLCVQKWFFFSKLLSYFTIFNFFFYQTGLVNIKTAADTLWSDSPPTWIFVITIYLTVHVVGLAVQEFYELYLNSVYSDSRKIYGNFEASKLGHVHEGEYDERYLVSLIDWNVNSKKSIFQIVKKEKEIFRSTKESPPSG